MGHILSVTGSDGVYREIVISAISVIIAVLTGLGSSFPLGAHMAR
jgi:hypothetical protein